MVNRLNEAKKMEKTINNIDNYVVGQVARHLDFLEKHSFIVSGNSCFSLTEIGKTTNINGNSLLGYS